jgi:hypothetical protein
MQRAVKLDILLPKPYSVMHSQLQPVNDCMHIYAGDTVMLFLLIVGSSYRRDA